MEEPARVLFVNSEIFPYMPETDIAVLGRYLPQGIQESGKEIRSFMPRYGTINERRNQLHEVIRLSGMNLVINNADRPLVIKVSSISSARMQVYFIDNEDYFHRKFIYKDAEGKDFKDNDERAVFFARGVLETVKKLRWKPDIVHCQGWISHFLPVFLKKVYHEDPIFTDAKVVLSLYNDMLDELCIGFGCDFTFVLDEHETELSGVGTILVTQEHIAFPRHIGHNGTDLQRRLDIAFPHGIGFFFKTGCDALEELHIGQRVAGAGHAHVTQHEVA